MFKKKLLTKGDISEPLTFQHTEHVGGKCYVCDGNCAHKDATSTKTKTDEKVGITLIQCVVISLNIV